MYKVRLENNDYHRLNFEFDDYEQMMIFAEYTLRNGKGGIKVTLSNTKDEKEVTSDAETL